MNIIKNENDILMISETKIDSSFPISRFTMTGYSIPFRFDRTSLGGGILLFVREDSFQNTDTFETGLSDFHKLTFTVLKQHFPKQKPRVVIHRQYKNFRNDYFRIELENALLKYDINNIDYDNFIKTFLTVLDKHAPIKKKYLRANHANFVPKQLRKAIMRRSTLCNNFLKDRNDASLSAYRKQCNFYVTLLRKAKKQYFSNLEPKRITDTKNFGNQLNHSSLIK